MGERRLPNLWAWGGCEAEPPGLTLAIILFRGWIETSGDEFSRDLLSSELQVSPKLASGNFGYGITAVSGVECGLSAPDEFTAVTVYT